MRNCLVFSWIKVQADMIPFTMNLHELSFDYDERVRFVLSVKNANSLKNIYENNVYIYFYIYF